MFGGQNNFNMLLQFILTRNYKLYQLVSPEMKRAVRNFAEQDVKNRNFSNLRRSNFIVEISGDIRDGWWRGEQQAWDLRYNYRSP